MTTKVNFVSIEEFRVLEDKRMKLAKARGDDKQWLADNNTSYGWARLADVDPRDCLMWYCPWYFDPNDPEDTPARERAMQSLNDGTFDKSHSYLSRFYWQDWSHIRPPICVMTPNRREWVIDAYSSNGDGWKVTGDPPLITCSPSIAVEGYHGFLQNGVFTDPL